MPHYNGLSASLKSRKDWKRGWKDQAAIRSPSCFRILQASRYFPSSLRTPETNAARSSFYSCSHRDNHRHHPHFLFSVLAFVRSTRRMRTRIRKHGGGRNFICQRCHRRNSFSRYVRRTSTGNLKFHRGVELSFRRSFENAAVICSWSTEGSGSAKYGEMTVKER